MDKLTIERINSTVENLKKNNMDAYYCQDCQKVKELVCSLINEGDTISSGGSVTLAQAGIIDILKSGRYNYLDRNVSGLTAQEIENIYEKTYSADAYFASSNAITENGELYNVDGNSNRVSAILYGPKKVILVCGYNKIVKNLDEAVKRVKSCAAPQNAVRLNCNTYCMKSGECVSLKNSDGYMCDGCRSENRICCNYVVSARQRKPNRIKVIIVGEELGY